MNDAELVRKAMAGDQEAAGAIYDRYAALVRVILLEATGSLAEANELVQEVFLRALGGLAGLRQPELLGGWLVGIARRQGADYRRKKARERRRMTPLVEDVPQMDGGGADEETLAVQEAIGRLPEQERLAVHVHYLCGEPAEAARSVLGLSPSGFYKVLARARERLRAELLKVEGRK